MIITKSLGAIALATTCIAAVAADRTVYHDRDIEVVVMTSTLPKEFAGDDSDADWQWFGVRTLVTRISVTVGAAHAVLPTRAYLGMIDPRSVEIKRSTRRGVWKLVVSGGDASTAYSTVMEFKNENVRTVKEYAGESDSDRPYVTETFSPPPVLN